MKTEDLRVFFLKYFENLGHQHVPSSSLVPKDDPTLLFTNAGMNQFKNIFLGFEKRDYDKATTIQKCVRAGGKHNDLDNVGFTARHHTFFEMLGNFSFGDYFKEDAIAYSWEFITKKINLPKDKLYVSVFNDDVETYELWTKKIGLSKDRVFPMGEAHNYWRMGASGPCGPCSEIYFDLGEDVGGDPKKNTMGGDGDRYLEIWNLVFMQFNESESKEKILLPKPSVDTGMGLERLASVLQGETSSYHTDENLQLIQNIATKAKVSYEKKVHLKQGLQHQTNVALRILADHAKATAFLMSDNVLPSNEGRGYVLRRIMRRALRYGKKISSDEKLFTHAVNEVILSMKNTYPELNNKKQLIVNTTDEEQKRFLKTLAQGTEIFNQFLKTMKGEKKIAGDVAFKLYDTYGFPFDLTQIMAAEKGLSVDEAEFNKHMNESKKKARLSWSGSGLNQDQAHLMTWSQEIKKDHGPTNFTGYMYNMTENGTVLSLSEKNKETEVLKKNADGFIILDKTCCYAEGGGQVGDKKTILKSKTGEAEVLDCTKKNDLHIHYVKVKEGFLSKNDSVSIQLNDYERREITFHHSATHLLHASLRKILGTHVTQAGSLVEAHRLRFDFTHPKPLSTDELLLVEQLVNQQIRQGHDVEKKIMDYDKAIKSGVLALFGEKYKNQVRTLKMGSFSQELCGGTHVNNTSEIKVFKILSETGVSSGVRRIEALAGNTAIDFLMLQNQKDQEVCTQLKTKDILSVIPKFDNLQKEVKQLKLSIKNIQSQSIDINKIISSAHSLKLKNGDQVQLIFEKMNIENRESLAQINDQLKNKIESGVVITLGCGNKKSCPIIISTGRKNKPTPIHAGDLLKKIAPIMAGQGGGHALFAQGTVENSSQFKKALQVTKEFILNS